MKDIKEFYLDAFDVENLNVRFLGGTVYQINEKYIIVNDKGYVLFLEEDLFQMLRKGNIDNDLLIKLLQRNMAIFLDKKNNTRRFDRNDSFGVKPGFFMIDLTNQCNMNCIYCFRNHDVYVISDEKIDEICAYIVRYCETNGMDSVAIQPWGGEPFLYYEKIVRILENISKKNIQVRMTIETNGTLLSEEKIKYLYERNVNISVSIDGYEIIQDEQRPFVSGNASYKQVVEGIRLLKKYYGDSLSILATITKKTYKAIDKIIKFFAKDLDIHYVKINFVHKSDFQPNDEICLSDEEISECSIRMFDTIVELNRQGVKINEYNIWNKMSNIAFRSRNDCCSSRGCNAGRQLIGINGVGDIFPCDLTDYQDEKIGTIYDDKDLITLVNEAIQKKELFKEKQSMVCEKCAWRFFCRGGCSVHIKMMRISAGNIDNIECMANKSIYPKILELFVNEPEIADALIVGNV